MNRTSYSRATLVVVIAGAVALTWFAIAPTISSASEEPFIIPPPKADVTTDTQSGLKTAVIAGGCFWGVQGVYQHTDGVVQAVSGYAGGKQSTASYETVSGGATGHAESVKITYDPQKISYGKILQIYFSVVADPTQLNRQGPDSGTQYRSAIFTSSPEERKITEDYITQLNDAKVYKRPIVTAIEPMTGFYPAEDYHQDYLTLHPNQPYIAFNDIPKVENLKKLFADSYRDKPVLVRDASNKATN
ncbi:MAG: peptide-methionine (S)-S-oxide reductase MsrA [Xanthobacteraceae bacterium]|nr:peptide-methionine (S)-S-oxide reductase MsrA [Xanthobacteraceae bacterium]